MKRCNSCGNTIPDDNAAFCNVCGAPQAQFSNYGTGVKKAVSKEEFLEHYATPKIKNGFKTAGIFGYVCAGISLLMTILALSYLDLGYVGYLIPSLIEIALILGLSIGIHTKRSKGCAIGLAVLGVVGCIYSLVTRGSASSWLIIAAGALGINASTKLDKEYNDYLRQVNGNVGY